MVLVPEPRQGEGSREAPQCWDQSPTSHLVVESDCRVLCVPRWTEGGRGGWRGQSMSESQPEPAQPCAEALGGQRD